MDGKLNVILIVTIKSWNISNFYKIQKKFNTYKFVLISSKEDLNKEKVLELNPAIIFFPHWSWKIPEYIYKNFECILFHMTDLPFGRGGSPLQNLILSECYQTKISAISVCEQIDAGDIYLQSDFNISTGSAQDIFIKFSEIVFNEMIPTLLKTRPTPQKQIGQPTYFKRRIPEESNILNPELDTTLRFYDFIRMLDAEGYPKAYLTIGQYHIEFSNAELKGENIFGTFKIKKNE